jgi:hypothetical protein
MARLPLSLVAVVMLLLSATAASAQSLWELSPYRVRVYIAFSDDPALTAAWRSDFRESLSTRIAAWIGSSWDAHVDLAPSPLKIALRYGPGEVPLDALPAQDLEEVDKVFCLHVQAEGGVYRFVARELDVRTRTWGATTVRQAGQSQLSQAAGFDALTSAFAPLAQIEKVEDKLVRLRLRAGNLKLRDPSVFPLSEPAVFQPIVRYNDREGKLRTDRPPQPVPWTYLLVRDFEGSTATCETYSGLRSPLSARRRGRSEQLALLARPRSEATNLVLHSRVDSQRRLYGYEIYAYSPDSPKTTLLGRTDSQGVLRVEAGQHPLRLLVVKNGGEFVARLPLMPGLEPEMLAPVIDDDYRLAVEGYITGMQEQIVDLVAQRGTLIARIRASLDDGKPDQARQLLEELKSLRSGDELAVLLAEQRRKYFSGDALVRLKISKLFDDTLQVIVRNLGSGEIEQVSSEVAQANRSAPNQSAAASPATGR